MASELKTLVIVPAFNEQDCIAQTISKLRQCAPELDYVIVNDGSKDTTQAICDAEGFNSICLPVNTGLTSAFSAGMKYALDHGYESALQFDADGQHLPEFIGLMQREMLESKADIVIASRLLAGQGLNGLRALGSKLISGLIKLTTEVRITDPTSGMRLYNRKMMEHFAAEFDAAPEPDSLAYLARKGAKIREIPAKMEERQGGESYFTFTSTINYMARTCLSIVLFQWLR